MSDDFDKCEKCIIEASAYKSVGEPQPIMYLAVPPGWHQAVHHVNADVKFALKCWRTRQLLLGVK